MWTTVLKSNSGICPCWKVPVTVRGWYKSGTGDKWEFLKPECEIIENSKLPREKQEQRFEMMYCPDPSSCPLYTEFQPDTTKDI